MILILIILFSLLKTQFHFAVITLSEQKLRTKIQQMSINIFSNQNYVEVYRLFILVYSCQDDDTKKFKTQGYYLPKGVIKNYNVIINEKNFFDQPVDSDLK